MKKILYLALCILLLAGMVACFAACGCDDEEIPEPTPSSKPADSTGSSTPNSSTTSSGGSEGGNDPEDDNPPPPPHEHTFKDEYSYDEVCHYYEASCEHTDEVSGIEPHAHDLYTGKCKCGHEMDIYENVVNIILANRGSVTSGKSVYKYSYLDYNSETTITTDYKFYEDYLHVRRDGDYIDDFYYEINPGDNSIFSVVTQKTLERTSVNLNGDASEENMLGAEFKLDCLEDGDSILYGAEEFVKYFYDLAIENTNGDSSFVLTENVFAISFSIIPDGSTNLYYVAVGFSVDEETNTLSTVSVMIDKYSSDSYELVDGQYVVYEGNEPLYKYSYIITQSTEDIEYVENPYDPEKVIVQSLVIKNQEGENIEDITYTLPEGGGLLYLKLDEITPSTALLDLCKIEISIVNTADGMALNGLFPFFDKQENCYKFNVSVPGTHKLTVKVNGKEFTTTLEIPLGKPSKISSQVYNFSTGVFEQAKKVEVYRGSPLYFKSWVEAGKNGAYKATILNNVGEEIATITDGTINGIPASVFVAKEIGEYTIKIESTVIANKWETMTVKVVEPPRVEDILSGKYKGIDAENGQSPITLEFNTELSQITVVFKEFDAEFSELLSYKYENGELSFESISGDGFTTDLYITENYEMYIVIDLIGEEYTYLLKSLVPTVELESTGQISVENSENTVIYDFEYYSNGSFVFYANGEKTNAISLYVKDGVYMFAIKGQAEQKLVKLEGEGSEIFGKYKTEASSANLIISEGEIASIVEKGNLILEDKLASNNDSNMSGTYFFVYENGEFTFYKDGEVYTKISLKYENGEYTFEYPNCSNPMTLKRDENDDKEGIEGSFGGYIGSFKGVSVKIVLKSSETEDEDNPTVNEDPRGTLEIEDLNGGTYTGTYTYEIVGGAFVIYKDGVKVDDMIINITIDGSYTFQALTSELPKVLVKVEGDEGRLYGKYNVNGANGTLFVLSFTPDNTPADDHILSEGLNHVKVNKGTVGTKVVLATATGGKYTLAQLKGEDNLVAYLLTEDGEVVVDLTTTYEFELAANETITFIFRTANGEADRLGVNLIQIKNQPPDVELPDEEL